MLLAQSLTWSLASSLALLAPVLPLRVEAATPPGLAATPVCAEPLGQTDTPPGPRLRRSVVHGVPVATVLPPGYASSGRDYPVVYLLHASQGDEDSWIEYGGLLDDTAARPARERAIVVMPRMGVITGLAVDWVDGYRRDATFIGRTLVRWADRTWRTQADRRHRAIAGYSGGGLSAAHVAEEFPQVFGQLGVFSGPLDLRNPVGQPAAYATFEAEKLCAGDDPLAAGPLGDPLTHAAAWAHADPLHRAARLSDTFVWMTSGTGVPCNAQEATAVLLSPAAATEPQMRAQTEAFSAALTAARVRHVDARRPCGLHWWTTWRPALNRFWDLASARWAREGRSRP